MQTSGHPGINRRIRQWLLLLVAISCAIASLPSLSFAQKKSTEAKPPQQGEKSNPADTKAKGTVTQGSSKGSKGVGAQALFKLIDPEKYILGPGDGIAVNLWGAHASFEEVLISADGKLTLPTLGELKAAGLTLRQTEDLIKLNVKKYYTNNVYAGIALSSLRSFKVPVLGAVANPGHYEATLDMRVSDLLDEAGGLLPSASRRHIQVKRGDTVRIEADLTAYLRMGSVKDNPFLLEGDLLFVPATPLSTVWLMDEASTDMESPLTLYEIKEGQTLADLIKELGGVNPAWDLREIHIVRNHWSEKGTGTVQQKIDLHALLFEGDASHDTVLHQGDYIFFARKGTIPYLNGHDEVTGIEVPYGFHELPSHDKHRGQNGMSGNAQ